MKLLNCFLRLISATEEGVTDRQTALILLGTRFRVAIQNKIAPWEPDEVKFKATINDCVQAVSRHLIKKCICIHLDSDEDKFHCLSLMAQKLISLALGEILPESPDNPQFQEATVSGHIFLLILRERLENVLGVIRSNLNKIEKKRGDKFILDA